MILEKIFSRSLTSDSASQLNVLGHDGHSLGMDGAQIGILKQTNHIGLSSFLNSENSLRLESQITLVLLSDLTDQALEGQLSDE